MLLKVLLGLLAILLVFFAIIFTKDFFKAKNEGILESDTSYAKMGIVGFIAVFLDNLGIGSFAIITAFSKNFKLIKDKKLPGTLMVSTTITGIISAFVFLNAIVVDPLTLVIMTVAASVGAYLGAGIISKFSEKAIQLTMGLALGIVAIMILLGQLKLMPIGGDALGLTGINLVLAAIVMFILGVLMNVGVGLFAPCMAVVYTMGMSPAAAFPIMMSAAAFLQPVAGYKFIQEGTYDRKASLAITLAGIPAALIACFIVKEIPLYALKWIILAVVVYTSYRMINSYMSNNRKLHIVKD